MVGNFSSPGAAQEHPPLPRRFLLASQICILCRIEYICRKEIGLFTWEEAEDAFADTFACVEGPSIRREEADTLNEASYGYPYLSCSFWDTTSSPIWMSMAVDGRHVVNWRDVDEVVPMAVRAYERRALKPLVDELSDLKLKYLRAMSECLDEERLTDYVRRPESASSAIEVARQRRVLKNPSTCASPASPKQVQASRLSHVRIRA